MEAHTIDTASGRKIDFDESDPAQIALEDIAGGLSRICRFGAQSVRFHSVAEHAVLVAQLLHEGGYPHLALAGLHHDSHEAYVCDIPKPLKRKLTSAGETVYEQVCRALDRAIATRLGLTTPSSDDQKLIKDADNKALMIEAADLLPDHGPGIAKATGLPMEQPGANCCLLRFFPSFFQSSRPLHPVATSVDRIRDNGVSRYRVSLLVQAVGAAPVPTRLNQHPDPPGDRVTRIPCSARIPRWHGDLYGLGDPKPHPAKTASGTAIVARSLTAIQPGRIRLVGKRTVGVAQTRDPIVAAPITATGRLSGCGYNSRAHAGCCENGKDDPFHCSRSPSAAVHPRLVVGAS